MDEKNVLKVGYLGPRGTFTDEAARGLFPTPHGVELISCRTISDVLNAVEDGHLDHGVVPIENSTEGSVSITLDMLVHDVNLQIEAEIILPVRHHLMVRPGRPLHDVQRVYSHPQAIAQCRKSLETLLPSAALIAATSTAEAAEQVSQSSEAAAAIGTKLAASFYNLDIVVSDVQDGLENETRFILVGRNSGEVSGRDKTSIVFAFDADKPGNLFGALKAFADRKINLSKLESRPAKRGLGAYIFFADLDGHRTDQHIKAALAEVHSQCSFFKVLGSYPRADHSSSDRRQSI